MKFALITTTIYVPEVLREYRRLGPDVAIVVAGDLKTPDETRVLVEELGGVYLDPGQQEESYPGLSEAIGWNSVQRRNIAILEAAKLNPDVIVSIDDDNIPKGDTYFTDIEEAFTRPHAGNMASDEWFHVGAHAHQGFSYRGLPRNARPSSSFGLNGSHPVGVVNGLIYGDPDIDAVERIALNPQVDWYSPEIRDGIATRPARTWAPVNSQNTAWRADLAPLMFVLPHVGRYDDIWGSYIAQRVMSATDYCVRFGRPFVRQERNEQDVLRNLEDELFGMRHTPAVVDALRRAPVDPDASVLSNLGAVLSGLGESGIDLPSGFLREWVQAWSAS